MRRPRRFGAAIREAGALLTQARYLSRDLGMSIQPGDGPKVVLLHGLYASAGVWRPLRSALHNELGAATYAISYVPGPSIARLASRLDALIREIPGDEPLHFVGHSFGGLAMRWYVRAPTSRRVLSTTSLASPFLGSQKNGWVPGAGGRDLRPDAENLMLLREASTENLRVPHLSIVAGEDQMIIPGAYPEYGEQLLIDRVGHNGILFHEEVIRRVVSRVRDFSV